MSEEKIIQHAEKAVHAVSNKKLSWKQKLKELLQEVLIIVFAISITLAFHNWNDHKKEQEIEREFLEGTRNDLKDVKAILEEGAKDFQGTVDFYDTLWTRLLANRATPGFIDSNAGQFTNTLYFIYDKGRFEGFKSSGYLRLIENKKLQDEIISLYTTDMPFEESADANVFRTREHDFITYIGSKAPIDSTGMHISKIIDDPAVRYQIQRYVDYFNERKRHKAELAQRIDKVIKDIDAELDK